MSDATRSLSAVGAVGTIAVGLIHAWPIVNQLEMPKLDCGDLSSSSNPAFLSAFPLEPSACLDIWGPLFLGIWASASPPPAVAHIGLACFCNFAFAGTFGVCVGAVNMAVGLISLLGSLGDMVRQGSYSRMK